mgnify:CR=1 FL=1
MTKKYIGIILFLILFLTPFYLTFAQTSNAGFIPGNIWYSKDPFEEGDKIKIYTLIYNPDSRQLSGTVFFFDKTIFLGSKSFTVAGKGIQDVSIDWTATIGDHTIFGQIQDAKFLTANNIYQNASLSETKTSESKRSVSKKITLNTIGENISDSNTVSNIQNFVKENTPEVVSKTIDTTVSSVEEFREKIGTFSENKKEEVKKEIKIIEDSKITQNSDATKKDTEINPINQNTFLKPFKYAELFALTVFSAVFNNKYIFYGLIVLIIFFVIRYIIRKIF